MSRMASKELFLSCNLEFCICHFILFVIWCRSAVNTQTWLSISLYITLRIKHREPSQSVSGSLPVATNQQQDFQQQPTSILPTSDCHPASAHQPNTPPNACYKHLVSSLHWQPDSLSTRATSPQVWSWLDKLSQRTSLRQTSLLWRQHLDLAIETLSVNH